jgi:non-homologous end joining protein Ku
VGPAKKTVLTFGMVSIPVGLVSATKSDNGSAIKIIAPVERNADGELPETGMPVKQKYIDPSKAKVVKGEEVIPMSAVYGRDECGRAVDRGGEVYQPIDADDYAALSERMEYMELLGFITEKEFTGYRDRIDCAHYVQPQPGSARALGTLAKAMRAEHAVGVVRFSVGSRERLGALVVRDDLAVEVLTIEFAESWKQPDEEVLAPALAEPSKAERDMARELVKALGIDASVLDDVQDGTRARQREMVEQVLAGAAPVASEPAPQDLMATLEASVTAAKKERKRTASGTARKKVAA